MQYCFLVLYLSMIYPVDSAVQLLKQLHVRPGKQDELHVRPGKQDERSIIIVDPLCSKLAKTTLANIE